MLCLAVLLAACAGSASDGSGPGAGGATVELGPDAVTAGTTAPTTASQGLGEGWAGEVRGRTPLRGFSEVAATITAGDGTTCEVCLLAAATAEQRERGLMEVTDPDLGGYDGMLFEYPDPVDGAFWMRNTPMPLSIAYFDADRTVVSTADMAPCEDSTSCPQYPADAPFQYALEVPQGRLAEVGVVGLATIEVTAVRCPLAG
ncbi:hypothetical protein BH10ACT1_BH10ACT1_06420 [soil metagenome]